MNVVDSYQVQDLCITKNVICLDDACNSHAQNVSGSILSLNVLITTPAFPLPLTLAHPFKDSGQPAIFLLP